MNNKNLIGLGMFTQYCVLKFIHDNKPIDERLRSFISKNYNFLYPPTGFSRYQYLDSILDIGLIIKDEQNVISLTKLGENEYEQLSNKKDGIRIIEERYSVDFSM